MKRLAATLTTVAAVGVGMFALARNAPEEPSGPDIERWEKIKVFETDRVVTDYADLHGALMQVGDSYFQILEAQLGVTTEGVLGFSKLTYLTDGNETLSFDRSGSFSDVYTSIPEIRGGYVFVGSPEKRTRLYVDDVKVVVDGAGYLQLRYAYGYDDTGRKVYLATKTPDGVIAPFAEAIPGNCAFKTTSACIPPMGYCTTCGSAPHCPCTNGTIDCTAGMITLCRPNPACSTWCDTEVIEVPPFGIPIVICFCSP